MLFRSGILLDGELYSQHIPQPMLDKLEPLLNQIAGSGASRGRDAVVELEGVPFGVFLWHLNPDAPFPPAWQVGLYSLQPYAARMADLRLRILGFGIAGLGFGLLFALGFAHRLTDTLRAIVAGTKAIQAGDLTVQVPVQSRDEIGQLARSFNEMVTGLALKEKYHNVLNLVADRAVAEQLMNGSVTLGGERRVVSILFCDIRGFTALTQGMSPEQVISLLNEHMTALTKVVHEHRGVVDKFVGDLLMAVFGAPKSYGGDAERAVRCAVRMLEARAALNQRAAQKIQVGIGLATGEVVAGCMGSSDRIDYTVLGARVNLASRLCDQAGPGQIVLDETTREESRDLLRVAPLPPLILKGFAEPIHAHELLEFHPARAEA